MGENKLTKKYGLITAIAMVVGIVIGSGVFFKAQIVLEKTKGDVPMGVLAWLIGGAIMVVCALAFATMATTYEKVNGIVDYAEATVGGKYAYLTGWFIATVYYPSMTSVLAWLSARYTLEFVNSVFPGTVADPAIGSECMVLTLVLMIASYALNALSPKLAGHFQVSTTVIKLIPLLLMGVVGLIVGLLNGTTTQNFTAAPMEATNSKVLLGAVVSTAFAYEGWIIATSINAELKNSKRNLPIALTVGAIIISIIYVTYYIGVAGGARTEVLINEGATAAFHNVFGAQFGNILNLFVAISCMGTLNGLMLATARGMYAVAARGRGPAPETLGQIDPRTNVPTNSAIIGLFLTAIWFFFFYGSQLQGWFGGFFGFDSSELPIVTIYAFYLPIFVNFMRRAEKFGFCRRFLIPALAILGSLFMIYAAFASHGIQVFAYLMVFAVFMLVGIAFDICRSPKRG